MRPEAARSEPSGVAPFTPLPIVARTYGEAIGLDPDFTVMDQSDAEDLMDASRQDHALGSKEKRFPRKQTCLSIYSRCVNSSDRLDHTHERFDHILVDEYQDTNRLQSSILHRMRALDRNLTVVGDDAQSIYSFRAAEVRNILDFPAEFPGATEAKGSLTASAANQ